MSMAFHDKPHHWIIPTYGLWPRVTLVARFTSSFEETQSSAWPEKFGGRSSLFHFPAAFVQKTGQFTLATFIRVAVYRGFRLWHPILVLVFISVVQCYEELCAHMMTIALCVVNPGSRASKSSGISPVETCSAYIDHHSRNLQCKCGLAKI